MTAGSEITQQDQSGWGHDGGIEWGHSGGTAGHWGSRWGDGGTQWGLEVAAGATSQLGIGPGGFRRYRHRLGPPLSYLVYFWMI